MTSIYKKKFVIYTGFVTVLSLLAIILMPINSEAATSSLPNQSDFGSNVRLLVGHPSGSQGISAPTSVVKIYSTSPSISVAINGFGQCSGDGYDYNNPGTTTYEIYRTTSNENQTGGALASSSNGANCSPANSTLNATHPGPRSSLVGHTNYYVFVFRATLAGSSLGFNGFSLSSPGALIGYSEDSGDRFAIKSQFSLSSPSYSSYTLRFGTSCEITSPISKTINWFDADQGEPNQLRTISFDLYDDTDGSYVLQNVTNVGGNNAGGSRTVTFQPGHKYRWIWRNVSSYNGIQMEFPFDSIYNRDCPEVQEDPDLYSLDIYGIDASELINSDPSSPLVNPNLNAITNRRQASAEVSISYASPDNSQEFLYRPPNQTTYQSTRPTTTTTNQAEVNAGGGTAPRLRTTAAEATKVRNTPPRILSGAAADGGDLYYITSGWEQGATGSGEFGTNHQNNVVEYPNSSIIDNSGLTRILHFYYDCSDPVIANQMNSLYDGPCPDIEIGTCPSYDPYNTFAPLFPQPVDLPEGNQPSDREDSVRTSTINNGSVSAGFPSSWSTTSGGCPTCLSRTQEQERTYSQSRTGDRWAYYYVHNDVTRVNSVQDEHGQNTDYVGGDNGSVDLDYRPHYDRYPYDTHTPEIDYDAEYDERRYSETGTSRRERDASRTRTQSRETIEDDDGNVTGYTLWSTDAGSTGSWPSNPDNFISSASWSAWGNFSGDRGSYTVTDQVWGTASLQTSGDTMPPCFPRSYEARPLLGSPQLDPTFENPNESRVGASILVDFVANDGPSSAEPFMRERSRINNLPYTIETYVLRNDGSQAGNRTRSGTVDVTASTAALDPPEASAGTSPSHRRYAVSVAPPADPDNMEAGDRVCWILSVGPSTGWVGSPNQADGSILSTSPYQSSGTQQTSPTCTGPVRDEPYVSVFGADVIAGNGIGTNCNIGNRGIIAGQHYGTQGSGAQFAAIAMTQIDRFASAKMRANTPRGLSFASNAGTYGGGYSGTHCVNDYYAQIPPDITSTSSLNSVLSGASGKLAHYISPTDVSSSSGNNPISNGRHITLYTDGDVELSRNIRFQRDNWNRAEDIPSFFLIVNGDLYIDKDVSRLDGIYIATGNIYTCSDGRNGISANFMFIECDEQLTVNGSLIANTIKLNRYAQSSVRVDTQTQHPNVTGNNLCAGDVQRQLCAAEVINFSPELYLTEPSLPTTSRPGQARYDAMTTLPPVL